MFCKNCGKELSPELISCDQCGFQKGTGDRFCANCGNEYAPGAVVCGRCGCPVSNAPQVDPNTQKSKIAAGILGILLGGIGVHNFYLGYTGKAVAQLLLGTIGILACCLGPMASSIWGLVEGIMILCGSINKDSKGVPLKE